MHLSQIGFVVAAVLPGPAKVPFVVREPDEAFSVSVRNCQKNLSPKKGRELLIAQLGRKSTEQNRAFTSTVGRPLRLVG
jgi:hypothetical protein